MPRQYTRDRNLQKICPGCGSEFSVFLCRRKQRHCSLACRSRPLTLGLMLGRADCSDAGGCWTWTMHRDKDGYGRIRHRGRDLRAHVVVWGLAHAQRVPSGMLVMHTCDNPPCIRPDHLLVGTHRDNQRDKWAKGRGPSGDQHPFRKHPELVRRGSQSPHAKLTESDVLLIRERLQSGQTQDSVAAMFGVSQATISGIALRQHWKHVA